MTEIESNPQPTPVAPLINIAKAVGLRRLVKAGRLTAEEALRWLRQNDYSGSDRIVLWLQRRAGRHQS